MIIPESSAPSSESMVVLLPANHSPERPCTRCSSCLAVRKNDATQRP